MFLAIRVSQPSCFTSLNFFPICTSRQYASNAGPAQAGLLHAAVFAATSHPAATIISSESLEAILHPPVRHLLGRCPEQRRSAAGLCWPNAWHAPHATLGWEETLLSFGKKARACAHGAAPIATSDFARTRVGAACLAGTRLQHPPRRRLHRLCAATGSWQACG